MDRDQGLRRVKTVTAGLAGIGLAGVVAVAVAVHQAPAAAATSSTSGTGSTTTGSDDSDSTGTNGGTTDNGYTFPGLDQGSGGGQATSGGS